MENIIVVLALLLTLAGAIFSIRSQKKQGKKCVGCPNSTGCCNGCPGTK